MHFLVAAETHKHSQKVGCISLSPCFCMNFAQLNKNPLYIILMSTWQKKATNKYKSACTFTI